MMQDMLQAVDPIDLEDSGNFSAVKWIQVFVGSYAHGSNAVSPQMESCRRERQTYTWRVCLLRVGQISDPSRMEGSCSPEVRLLMPAVHAILFACLVGVSFTCLLSGGCWHMIHRSSYSVSTPLCVTTCLYLRPHCASSANFLFSRPQNIWPVVGFWSKN